MARILLALMAFESSSVRRTFTMGESREGLSPPVNTYSSENVFWPLLKKILLRSSDETEMVSENVNMRVFVLRSSTNAARLGDLSSITKEAAWIASVGGISITNRELISRIASDLIERNVLD